jgi:hypothetical protein
MTSATQFLKSNIGTIGAAVGGAALGAGVVYVATRRKKKRSAKRSSRTTRKRSTSRKRARTRRTPRTAGKRKDRSTKRIRYTKNGQPYVLMASGKARFIKKRGAKSARKRKGGRY